MEAPFLPLVSGGLHGRAGSSHDAGLAQTLDGETKDRAHKSARIGTCCAMPGKWADPAQDFCVPVAIMRNKS
jgi:hypothetical protein